MSDDDSEEWRCSSCDERFWPPFVMLESGDCDVKKEALIVREVTLREKTFNNVEMQK